MLLLNYYRLLADSSLIACCLRNFQAKQFCILPHTFYILLHTFCILLRIFYKTRCLDAFHILRHMHGRLRHMHDRLLHIDRLILQNYYPYFCMLRHTCYMLQHKPGIALHIVPFLVFLCNLQRRCCILLHMPHRHQCSFGNFDYSFCKI